MAIRADRERGDTTEALTVKLLKDRGYEAELYTNKYHRVYDLLVSGPVEFQVSVKSSKFEQVVFTSYRSLSQHTAPNFLFAYIPVAKGQPVNYDSGDYRLLIIPAEIARVDGLQVLKDYCARPSVLAKHCTNGDWTTYDDTPKVKKRHKDIWARWCEYEDAWHLLPSPP